MPKEKKTHPLPPKDVKMAAHNSQRMDLAKNAPDVPDWFGIKNIEARRKDEYVSSEEIYFKWRWYYADRMIEEEFKK